MSDGIFLAPYPVVSINPFAGSSEGNIKLQSSNVGNSNNATTAITTSQTTTTTNQSAEDAATLELRTQKLKDRYREKEEQKALASEEVTYIKQGQTCLLVFGSIFTFLALAAAAIAFGTPEWRVYDTNDPRMADIINVNPSLRICTTDTAITTCQFFTSRVRGLFVTCYADSSIIAQAFPDALASSWLNGYQCVWEQKYNIQGTPITTDNNCGEDPSQSSAMVATNANLMRAQWLAFAAGIICLVVGFIFTLVSCSQMRVNGSMCAGILLLVAVLLLLTGMVLYLAYTYMEEDKVRCPPFYGTTKKNSFSGVGSNTNVYFGFSFYLGWSSFAMAILGCGFVLGAACMRREAQGQIDKAMYRITQITKEERTEKKFEEMEAKKRRKEMQKQMKRESRMSHVNTKMNSFANNNAFSNGNAFANGNAFPANNVIAVSDPFATANTFAYVPTTPQFYSKPANNRGWFSNMFNKMKRNRVNFSDGEIDYDLRREKENRMRKLRFDAEDEIELESSKIRARKEKQLKEMRKAQRDLEEMDNKIKVLEMTKKRKERMRRTDDSSDSDSDCGVRMRDDHYRMKKRCVSVDSFNNDRSDNWFRIDRKCGRVVGPPEFRMQSCCDPYTLHLPTGFNPPPYQP